MKKAMVPLISSGLSWPWASGGGHLPAASTLAAALSPVRSLEVVVATEPAAVGDANVALKLFELRLQAKPGSGRPSIAGSNAGGVLLFLWPLLFFRRACEGSQAPSAAGLNRGVSFGDLQL